jgi:hypothetical protein
MPETVEPAAAPDGEDFLKTLENGVRDVLKKRGATAAEKVAAIAAGVKVAMIKHKVSGADEDNFFK